MTDTLKVKVTDGRQIVTEDGKTHLGGDTVAVPRDDAERYLQAGYVTQASTKARRK